MSHNQLIIQIWFPLSARLERFATHQVEHDETEVGVLVVDMCHVNVALLTADVPELKIVAVLLFRNELLREKLNLTRSSQQTQVTRQHSRDFRWRKIILTTIKTGRRSTTNCRFVGSLELVIYVAIHKACFAHARVAHYQNLDWRWFCHLVINRIRFYAIISMFVLLLMLSVIVFVCLFIYYFTIDDETSVAHCRFSIGAYECWRLELWEDDYEFKCKRSVITKKQLNRDLRARRISPSEHLILLAKTCVLNLC